MPNIEFISSTYRLSDVENQTFSLRERLGAGQALFLQQIKDFVALEMQKAAAHPENTNESESEESALADFFSSRVKWSFNPFSWLESFFLHRLNVSTYKHTPFESDSFIKARKIAPIMFFCLLHAAAKTLNQVLTPIAPVFFVATVIALGLSNPISIALLSVAGFFFIVSALHFAIQSTKLKIASGDLDKDQTDWTDYFPNPFPPLLALIQMVFKPVTHLFQKAATLYKTHPKLAIAAGILSLAVVAAMLIFPYVGVPAVMGFEFGSVLGTAATAFEGVYSGVLSSLGPAITQALSITTIVALTAGALDLTLRAFKEMAGWYDKGLAKAAVKQWVNTKTGATLAIDDNAIPSPSLTYQNDVGTMAPTANLGEYQYQTHKLHILGYIGSTTNEQKNTIEANITRWKKANT